MQWNKWIKRLQVNLELDSIKKEMFIISFLGVKNEKNYNDNYYSEYACI